MQLLLVPVIALMWLIGQEERHLVGKKLLQISHVVSFLEAQPEVTGRKARQTPA